MSPKSPSKKPIPESRSGLKRYAAMRDFEKTPEPSGAGTEKAAPASGKRLRFVVQMHRATRLHYDFRLEANGVLMSWAIPKGPSLDPAERRLAMHVEDHPYDYRDFEGIIPKGNYGAGEVVVWDRGWYAPLETDDPAGAVEKGKFKFILHGKKLNGMFSLVRIKNRDESGDPWLLIKDQDKFVDPKWAVESVPESVKSGKTLADFAKDPHAPHWNSSRPVATRRPTATPAHVAALPHLEQPMLATLAEEPFDDPKWLFEIKWDGYRALAEIDADGSVKLTSRNGKDFLEKFPELADLAAGFSERPLIVDGEIAVLDENGRSSFQGLQQRMDRYGRSHGSVAPITFIAFDLPYGNGRDLRREPLEARKAALEAIVNEGRGVLYSKHVVGSGKALFDLARERGLEGIVAKRRDSKYVDRRSKDWLKIKAVRRTECVIAGWTEGRGSRKGFGALLLGVYHGDELVSAGSVGTGFDAKLLTSISARLAPLERKTSPFAKPPKTDAPAHWVRPELVAEVDFGEWTRDGQLRHPVFVGLRMDKDPKDVIRERASAVRDESPRQSAPGRDSPPGAAKRERSRKRPSEEGNSDV